MNRPDNEIDKLIKKFDDLSENMEDTADLVQQYTDLAVSGDIEPDPDFVQKMMDESKKALQKLDDIKQTMEKARNEQT